MTEYSRLLEIVKRLRAKDGCPWDREQTHESLKKPCIEEAAELVAGINMYTNTGDYGNMKEELGDLLLQVVMNAVIAEEEGLFTMEDVCKDINEKLIRRHPHVFGDVKVNNGEEALSSWNSVKEKEKSAKNVELELEYLFKAFDESKELIEIARKRKLDKYKKQ